MSSTFTSHGYSSTITRTYKFQGQSQSSLTSISMADLPTLDEEPSAGSSSVYAEPAKRKSSFSAYETMKRFEASAASTPTVPRSPPTTPPRRFGYGSASRYSASKIVSTRSAAGTSAIASTRTTSSTQLPTPITTASSSKTLHTRSQSVAAASTSPSGAAIPFPTKSPSSSTGTTPHADAQALHRQFRASRSRSVTHRSSLALAASSPPDGSTNTDIVTSAPLSPRRTSPRHRPRTPSPDVEAILQRTPRPRRGSSASVTFSPRGGKHVPADAMRTLGSAVRKGSLDSSSPRYGYGVPNIDHGSPILVSKQSGRVTMPLGKGKGSSSLIIEPKPDPGDESDSDLDVQTPLPALMVRHGLLSPKSKLLASDIDNPPTDDRPGSVFSTRSNNSLFRRDERDTPMRRVRHRDGKTLRGGIGLTTGLGWSDSEDEDAPSALTKSISALDLKKSASQSTLSSPALSPGLKPASSNGSLSKNTPTITKPITHHNQITPSGSHHTKQSLPLSAVPEDKRQSTSNASRNSHSATKPSAMSTPRHLRAPSATPLPPPPLPSDFLTDTASDNPSLQSPPSLLSLTIPHYSSTSTLSDGDDDDESTDDDTVLAGSIHTTTPRRTTATALTPLDENETTIYVPGLHTSSQSKSDPPSSFSAMPYFVPGLSARARSKMRRIQPAGPRSAIGVQRGSSGVRF